MPNFLNTLGQGIQSAQMNPLFNIGLGLLSTSGPSPFPQSTGQRIAQGLLAGGSLQQQAMLNEEQRQQLRDQQQQREAEQKLMQLMNTPLPPESIAAPDAAMIQQQQMQELLSQARPEAFVNAMAQQQFGGAQIEPTELARNLMAAGIDPASPQGQEIILSNVQGGQRQTSLERNVRSAFGLGPNDPLPEEARDEIRRNINRADLDDQLHQQVKTELALFNLANARREVEQEGLDREQQFGQAGSALNSALKNIMEAGNLNNVLATTFLRPGSTGVETRRALSGGIADIRDMLGIDTRQARERQAQFDRYDKLTSDIIIENFGRISGGGFGAGTNQKMQLLSEASAGLGVDPNANRLIFADSAESLLQTADIEGINVPNREQVEEFIQRQRSPIEVPEAQADDFEERARQLLNQGRSGQGLPSSTEISRLQPSELIGLAGRTSELNESQRRALERRLDALGL